MIVGPEDAILLGILKGKGFYLKLVSEGGEQVAKSYKKVPGLFGISEVEVVGDELKALAKQYAEQRKLLSAAAPKSLGQVNLKGTIQGYGMTLAEEGKFFGWNPSSVSKSASDFTKEQLLARGWTKERLLEVAEKYEWINKLTPGHGNPSAAGRAAQLRELVEKLF